MTEFKTPKGTTLPLLDLRGKPYLQAAHRLVWFREEKPDWRIETRIVEMQPDFVICRAEIRNEKGDVQSTAHKREDYKHFPDALEKAETSAIGRALAMVGYGTQFAPDLDEEDRIVDSPAIRAKPEAPKQETKGKTAPEIKMPLKQAPGPTAGDSFAETKLPTSITPPTPIHVNITQSERIALETEIMGVTKALGKDLQWLDTQFTKSYQTTLAKASNAQLDKGIKALKEKLPRVQQ